MREIQVPLPEHLLQRLTTVHVQTQQPGTVLDTLYACCHAGLLLLLPTYTPPADADSEQLAVAWQQRAQEMVQLEALKVPGNTAEEEASYLEEDMPVSLLQTADGGYEV